MRGSALSPVVGGLILATVACGGKETTASRSAAAYDEAVRKGVAPSGGAHGGHEEKHAEAAEPSSAPGHTGHATPAVDKPMAGMDHSQMQGMAGMDHSKTTTPKTDTHAGHDTTATGHSQMPGMAGMDHSKMTGMAGMDHSKMTAPKADAHAEHDMTAMDHSQMPGMAGMDHSKMTGMNMAPPQPEPKAMTATPGQPAATLKPNEIDAPTSTSLEDSRRAEVLAGEMAGGGHAMSHGTYRQQDAGRDGASPPELDPHKGHEKPKPKPSPSPR